MRSPRFARLPLVVTSLLLLPALAVGAETAAAAAPAMLSSSVFDWDKTVVKPTPVGARREIADLPTATLERFECHISTLNPGKSSHAPHQHAQEEFIILKEGTLDVSINGVIQRVGPGSLFFFAANDWHNVANAGDIPATYLVFNLATAATRRAPAEPAAESAAPGVLRSGVFAWDGLEVKPTPRGARRDLFAAPTVTCARLSGHITTVNPREASHAAHRHADEEIIVVKEGRVEATINGESSVGGPGSIFFFASNDEHGLRNAGDTPATYYVFRVVTEKTPPL